MCIPLEGRRRSYIYILLYGQETQYYNILLSSKKECMLHTYIIVGQHCVGIINYYYRIYYYYGYDDVTFDRFANPTTEYIILYIPIYTISDYILLFSLDNTRFDRVKCVNSVYYACYHPVLFRFVRRSFDR